jgi:SsrA-binding protein
LRSGASCRSLAKPLQRGIILLMAAKSRKQKDGQSAKAVNKKAYRNFELVETFEAGLELQGTEVKSLRAGQADLDGSYARIRNGECWLIGAKIAQYQQAGQTSHEPTRNRKLLLHKTEIRRIRTKLEQRGFTLVPLRIYFSDRGLAKIELALARGKRQYDKRRAIAEREQRRAIERSTKKYRKKGKGNRFRF